MPSLASYMLSDYLRQRQANSQLEQRRAESDAEVRGETQRNFQQSLGQAMSAIMQQSAQQAMAERQQQQQQAQQERYDRYNQMKLEQQVGEAGATLDDEIAPVIDLSDPNSVRAAGQYIGTAKAASKERDLAARAENARVISGQKAETSVKTKQEDAKIKKELIRYEQSLKSSSPEAKQKIVKDEFDSFSRRTKQLQDVAKNLQTKRGALKSESQLGSAFLIRLGDLAARVEAGEIDANNAYKELLKSTEYKYLME